MPISPQIAGLKSSGVYRFEFDRSQTASIPAERIRLVIGFSKKGPFNTPVFVPDTGFFTDVFGDVDRSMERRGSFFHRTALAALERGPILALNLLTLNDSNELFDIDYVECLPLSTSATQSNPGKVTDALYSGYYNKDKFWFPNEESFLNNIGDDANNPNKILNIVNLGKSKLSVIVKKSDSQNTKGFNITAKEYYGLANVPEFLHPEDYLSDFMVDVIVLKGHFGEEASHIYPYSRFSSDPIFSDYFDRSKGLKRKKLNTDINDTSLEEFLNLPEVEQIASYTGCLIPDFIDLNGINISIQDQINRDTTQTGLFCAINKDAFDSGELISGVDKGIDLVGHNLEYEQPNSIEFLSYKETIKSDLSYDEDGGEELSIDATGALLEDVTGGRVRFTINKSDNLSLYNTFASNSFTVNEITPNRIVGAYLKVGVGAFCPVVLKQTTDNSVSVEIAGVSVVDFSAFLSVGNIYDGVLKYITAANINFVVDDTSSASISTACIIAGVNSGLYEDAAAGIITTGDKTIHDLNDDGNADLGELYHLSVRFVNNYQYIIVSGSEVSISDSAYYIPIVRIEAYEDSGFTTAVTTSGDFGFSHDFIDSSGDAFDGTLVIQTLKGSMNQSIETVETSSTISSTLKPNQVKISDSFSSDIKVGYYLVSNVGSSTESSRLTRITAVSRDKISGTLTITCTGSIHIYEIGGKYNIEVYRPIEEWAEYYTVFTLNGFSLGNYHLPNGTQEQQDAILNNSLSGTALFDALIDRDNITYRYIVDSFGMGITPSSKSILAILAKERKSALAIINAPAMKDFKASVEPSFVNPMGGVDSRYISEGGNLALNPTTVFSLPSIVQGSNYAAYFGPYLQVRDRGKNILIPPAGYVSNNFIDKYTNALPWSIVAGNRRGVVSGRGIVGIEYNLSKYDRDNLEPFGINPIIFQKGSGLVIMGNKTAQQSIKSALSNIHAREVLIYIQDGIEAILKNYLYEFNTPQTRLEIKTLADNFMSGVLADNGVYDFRNIMDETNNTPDVIDNNTGILDTYVEIVRGLDIIVHRTTVLKTGAISTGQYI